MRNDRFERALGIAGAQYAQTLLRGEIRSGGDLLVQSQGKPCLPWIKETITRIEVTTSSLRFPNRHYPDYPCFRFAHLMRDVEHVLLIGSMRFREGGGSFIYPNGTVVRDTGPLIVNPWLFFFTLEDAVEIGLAFNTADIIYTPFRGQKSERWNRLLKNGRITPSKLSALDCQL